MYVTIVIYVTAGWWIVGGIPTKSWARQGGRCALVGAKVVFGADSNHMFGTSWFRSQMYSKHVACCVCFGQLSWMWPYRTACFNQLSDPGWARFTRVVQGYVGVCVFPGECKLEIWTIRHSYNSHRIPMHINEHAGRLVGLYSNGPKVVLNAGAVKWSEATLDKWEVGNPCLRTWRAEIYIDFGLGFFSLRLNQLKVLRWKRIIIS